MCPFAAAAAALLVCWATRNRKPDVEKDDETTTNAYFAFSCLQILVFLGNPQQRSGFEQCV